MCPSRYSPAARPSRKRAPAAKKRQLSTVRSISKSMIERGLPTLRISRSDSVAMSASIASATLFSNSKRWRGVVSDHAPYASDAAATASSTSSASLDATSSSRTPVAGSSTSSVAPRRVGFHAPPMKLSRATVGPPRRTARRFRRSSRVGRYSGDAGHRAVMQRGWWREPRRRTNRPGRSRVAERAGRQPRMHAGPTP